MTRRHPWIGTASMTVALRNLGADRVRLVLSVLAVAVSIGLMLLLAGYRSGVYSQSSAYLDHVPGSIVVAEHGIRNFLGTSSTLLPDTGNAVRATPGVGRVIPIVSQFVVFESQGRKDGFFLIGYEPAEGGGPWRLVEGREPAAIDEIVMDRTTADQHQVGRGDRIALLDREATIVGLSDGTTFWAGSIAFTTTETMRTLLRAPGLVSFLLVTPKPGVPDAALVGDLAIAGFDALPKVDVGASDRRLMARIFDAPIGLMVTIAFIVGVLIVGLVIYTATIERRREYGTLKAVGGGNGLLYRVVITQALVAALAGAALGVAVGYGVGAILMAWRPQFRVEIEPPVVVAALVAGLLMALLAAVIPARAMARLEPAEVFRG